MVVVGGTVVPGQARGYNLPMPGVRLDQLSIAMSGLDSGPGGLGAGPPREVIERLAALAGARARCVQLDATLAGIRPRELDRSARRDLAAMLRRLEFSLSGLDLWIPAQHFAEPDHIDRALGATRGAIELCADLGVLLGSGPGVVCVRLHESTATDTLNALAEAALGRGVRLADCWLARGTPLPEGLGWGIDPATELLGGGDPVSVAVGRGDRLWAARLSDAGDGGRVNVGSSRGGLDVRAYRAVLQATGFTGPVVVDLAGLTDRRRGLEAAITAWEDARI